MSYVLCFSRIVALILLAILVVPVPRAVAQLRSAVSGFVVTQAGDTLRGRIEPSRRARRLHEARFVAEGAEAVVYPASALRAVEAPGVFVRHVRVVDGFVPDHSVDGRLVRGYGVRDTLLLEAVVLGPVRLYRADGWRAAEQFVFEQEGAAPVALHPRTYVAALSAAVEDCPGFVVSVPDGRRRKSRYSYTEVGLANLVVAYSRCLVPERVAEVFRPDVRTRTRFGVQAGLARNDIWMGTWAGFPEGSKYDRGRSVGGFVAFDRVYASHQRSLRVEMLLAERHTGVPKPGPFFGRPQAIETSATMIELPVVLRYTRGQASRPVRLYGEAGPFGSVILRQQLQGFRFTGPLFGLVFGGGVTVFDRVDVSVRGSHSIVAWARRTEDDQLKNGAFVRALTLGVGFTIR